MQFLDPVNRLPNMEDISSNVMKQNSSLFSALSKYMEINTYKFIYSEKLMEYETLEEMIKTINSFLTLLCPHLTEIIYSNKPDSIN